MVDRDDFNDEPASEAEQKLAEELRRSLETGESTADGDFLRAVSLAHQPRPLPPAENERLVEAAVSRPSSARRSNVVRIAFGGVGVLALAASVLLYAYNQGTKSAPDSAPVASLELVPVRSTQPLFEKRFEAKSTSARIDRIAMARESDLRENRFARWGVR